MAFYPQFSSYVCALDFEEHTDSVNALAFSPDGRLLASGGDDGLLYVLVPSNGRVVQKLRGNTPVTALQWDSRKRYQLYAGFGDGRVIIIQVTEDSMNGFDIPRDDTYKGPVEAFAVDTNHQRTRLVVCVASAVEIWTMVGDSPYVVRAQHRTLLPPPSVVEHPVEDETHYPIVPRSVHVVDGGRLLIVSYLNHGIVCWESHNGQFLWHINPRTRRIGRSTMLGSCLLVLSNLYDGFDVYDIESKNYVKTYSVRNDENLPLPVVATADALEVVTGTSSGDVRVFDTQNVQETQHLDHDGVIIQALACCDVEGRIRLLATGSSERGRLTAVKIWQRNLVLPHRLPRPTSSLARQPSSISPLEATGTRAPSLTAPHDPSPPITASSSKTNSAAEVTEQASRNLARTDLVDEPQVLETLLAKNTYWLQDRIVTGAGTVRRWILLTLGADMYKSMFIATMVCAIAAAVVGCTDFLKSKGDVTSYLGNAIQTSGVHIAMCMRTAILQFNSYCRVFSTAILGALRSVGRLFVHATVIVASYIIGVLLRYIHYVCGDVFHLDGTDTALPAS